MSIRVEEAGVSSVDQRSGVKTAGTTSAKAKAGINGKTLALNGLPNLNLEREAGKGQASPAINSLLNMMNLRSDSARVELYLAEIVQSARDTANRVSKSKIDLLSSEKISQLKQKQEKIAAAQAKLDEASNLQSGSKIWSYIQFGISLFASVASIALVATGVGAGAGVLIMASMLTTLSTVNQGVAMATGKGMIAHAASLAGASKNTAMWCDTIVSAALAVGSMLLVFGPFGLPAAAAAIRGLDTLRATVQGTDAVAGLTSGAIGLRNAGVSYEAGTATSEGLQLNSLAKEIEAKIQQMDVFLQHATDSMVASTDRNNQLVTALLKSSSDLSDAMTRVRFAS